MDVEKSEQRYADKVIEANYGLWNALLTLNGILLSVFSVIAIFVTEQQSWLLIILIVSCSISALMVLLNYNSVRNAYRSLGSLSVDQFMQMSESERSDDIKKGVKTYKYIDYREQIAKILLMVEFLIILSMLIQRLCVV